MTSLAAFFSISPSLDHFSIKYAFPTNQWLPCSAEFHFTYSNFLKWLGVSILLMLFACTCILFELFLIPSLAHTYISNYVKEIFVKPFGLAGPVC